MPADTHRITAETFVLGVGAQKSGTTWLHAYLYGHPQVCIPLVKELHYFDTVLRPDLFRIDIRKKLRTGTRRAHAGNPDAAARAEREVAARLEMTDDPESYLDFFRWLDPQRRVTGEVTPSYCGLPAEDLRRVRTLLAGAGLKVRVVFLMRDPVERAISQARMMVRMHDADPTCPVVRQEVLRRVVKPGNMVRARYHEAVRNLRAAFAPEELHFEFFETFLNPDAHRALCAFLGIDYLAPDFADNPNPSDDVRFEVGAAERDRLYQALRPVYDGCREIFGDRIPDAWMTAP